MRISREAYKFTTHTYQETRNEAVCQNCSLFYVVFKLQDLPAQASLHGPRENARESNTNMLTSGVVCKKRASWLADEDLTSANRCPPFTLLWQQRCGFKSRDVFRLFCLFYFHIDRRLAHNRIMNSWRTQRRWLAGKLWITWDTTWHLQMKKSV